MRAVRVIATVQAEIARGEWRSLLWTQLIDQAPGYADYLKRTTREIPMVILRPQGRA